MKSALSESDLIKSIHSWMQNHPNPADKCLVIGKTLYSPKEIVAEIDKGSKMGNEFKQDIINLAVELFMKAGAKHE